MSETVTLVACAIGRQLRVHDSRDWPGFRHPCPEPATSLCRIEDEGSLIGLCRRHKGTLITRGVIEATA